MMCFNRLPGGCCNYFEEDECVAQCNSTVANENFTCVNTSKPISYRYFNDPL